MAARLVERVSFPVDILINSSHEDLKISGDKYLSNLRSASPNCPEYLSLPAHGKVPIKLSTVGFVPLYGEEHTHRVLALFSPKDSITAVALYLADKWWSVDDIVRTSVSARQGLHQVKSVGERIVLYVLNRIIYRTQEMGRNETPFLCHRSNEYAKIMWKGGEAIGFYSVKPTGSICNSHCGKYYKLPVLDTAFVRLRHRERDSGLIILEDFVGSFNEKCLGLRYPLSSFMYTACKQYLEKYPSDESLLYEVNGPGYWFQRTCVAAVVQRERLQFEEASQTEKSCQAKSHFLESAAVSEAGGQKTELQTQLSAESQKGKESTDVHAGTSEDPNIAPASMRTRSSHLKCPRIGRMRQESGTSQGNEENTFVSESRLEPPAHTSESSEGLVEVSEENTVEKNEEKTDENKGQSLSEAELHVSNPEKQSEEEETVSEPLNGEITEDTHKTSTVFEEETANEVQSSESKLQSESQEEPLVLFVPLILESSAKPSEDTISEKGTTVGDSEMLTEESTLKEENTEEQQEPEKAATENAAASASKEEPSDNGLPNSMVTEAVEESVSENVSLKTASSLEDQSEEGEHNSQEPPVALNQSSLVMVELDGASFQQPSGQEAKNQLEEQSEETVEQMEQYTQTERAADSSSEEAEIEVPVVDRRSLRRKVKSYKGPPKKKGKSV
ncbi:soluble lamin-associated protein of 75 kDa isoform X2 [Melopsittacus undulatus]|uniref:soluble lamin-associated protein of 75 kDa isoform X2 n=1 Tax=Melopsittacus undulatus TaxID=13146 RepID=UPI00146B8C85|nr:soluble lamin-associated protein of 75 kDa isoform X2 [Melopsittacus undulatus]